MEVDKEEKSYTFFPDWHFSSVDSIFYSEWRNYRSKCSTIMRLKRLKQFSNVTTIKRKEVLTFYSTKYSYPFFSTTKRLASLDLSLRKKPWCFVRVRSRKMIYWQTVGCKTYISTFNFFSRESNSTIPNVHSSVRLFICLSVHYQTPQQL